MTSNRNGGIERNTVETTQGTRRPNLIYVLAAGLVLILLAFGGVWLGQNHHATGQPTNSAADAVTR